MLAALRMAAVPLVGTSVPPDGRLFRRHRLVLYLVVALLGATVLIPKEHVTGAGGDIAIYREATAADAITTADFDHDWDTTVTEDPSSFSLDVDNKSIKLKTGHYLVMYGARFDSTGGGNRSEVQSQLVLAGADLPVGWSQGYIRRSGGANEAFTSGGGIIQVASDDDPLLLRSFRTDNNSAGAARVANTTGIQLLKLYDDWTILRLHKSTTQTGPTTSAFLDVTYDQQDEIDATDFGHTGGSGDITLKTAGHYIVFANTYGALPSSSSDRSLITQKLTLGGADIDGTRTSLYIRGSNSTHEGAVSVGTLIETTGPNQVLNVEVNRLDGTAAWTINHDGTGATVPRTAITIVKVGDNADAVRLDDIGTDDMNPASVTPLGWDSEDEIDEASFTHPAILQPDSTIAVDATDKYLFLSAQYAISAGVTRAVYNQGWSLNGGAMIEYGQTGNFNRNSGANDVGNWSGILFDNMASGDYIEVVTRSLGASGVVGADTKGVQGLRLTPPPDVTPPAAPTGLTATGGDSTVSLDWNDNAEPDLASYNVKRATSPGGPYSTIATGVATSAHVDNGVSNGNTYYYVVSAVDTSSNESGNSNEDSATPADPTPPAPPTGLAATAGDGSVSLDWNDNAEPDLASYNVKRATSPGGPYSTIASGVATSTHVDNGVTNDTTYYYIVTAVDTSSNESGNSNEDSATPTDMTPPAAPTGLAATPGDGTVSLDWNDNAEPDLAGYNVYRHTVPGGPYSKINVGLVATSTFVDNGVSNGTTYYYVVRAEDGHSNESGNSSEASATPGDAPPAAPTGLVATAGDASVSLDWDDNSEPDLDSYNVKRGTSGGGPYSTIATDVATSTYVDNTASNGTTYYYVVTAVDTSSNESPNSNEDSATPVDVTPPAAPTGLVATAGDGSVSLDWSDNGEPDLASYPKSTEGMTMQQRNGR